MKIITRKGLASTAAKRWKDQFFHRLNTGLWYATSWGKSKEQIYNELVALGDDPAADAVDKAIGNDSWTSCKCDECNQEVEWVIRVGEEPDYESNTAHLCGTCIKKLTKLAKEMNK